MAVVQYTAIVNQIRGKLNGSVFNKGKNAYTLQRKQQPKKGLTKLQSDVRGVFSRVQRSWKLTTPQDRAVAAQSAVNNPVRDRFGNEVVLSGYNHWVKANVIRLQAGVLLANALSPAPAPPFYQELISSFVDYTMNLNGEVIITAGFISQVPVANVGYLSMMAYLSFPMSKGVTSYSGRFFFLGYITRGSGLFPIGENDLDVPPSKPQDYPVPEPGQKVILRVDSWSIGAGALVNSSMIEIEY